MRSILVLVALSILVACGKNDGVNGGGYQPVPVPPAGGGPIPQAPPPPGGGYYPPPGYGGGYSGGYPGGYPGGSPGYGPSSYFYPQMPTGYPSRYTPFVPIDNYMRRYPTTQHYWNNIWNGWVDYSYQYGYDTYDFNTFWFDYCPQGMNGTPFQPIYNNFDSQVYFWADYNTQYSNNMTVDFFWQNYDWMPYSNFDNSCSICY